MLLTHTHFFDSRVGVSEQKFKCNIILYLINRNKKEWRLPEKDLETGLENNRQKRK